jgi:L-serine dehydratase
MDFVSIFNDVLGPIMRGPSSSHTAGAYHIGKMARALLNDDPAFVRLTFDPQGSFAPTYIPLGVDLAFTVGCMGWSMLDERYFEAPSRAKAEGVEIEFVVAPLDDSNHPNGARLEMTSRGGRKIQALAEAIGGGLVRFTRLADWPVSLSGKFHEILIETDKKSESQIANRLSQDNRLEGNLARLEKGDHVLLGARLVSALEPRHRNQIESLDGITNVWAVSSVFYMKRGKALFSSAEEMVSAAVRRNVSLGEIALAYESEILGLGRDQVMEEILHRFDVMKSSVQEGLDNHNLDMLLLKPSAGQIYKAEAEGRLALGGIHARAAARSMAVMHVCNSRGVICAAPTGGSAGVVPGVVVSLVEELGLTEARTVLALLAASAVGLVVAKRATFAAETAGCQVEIGVAGAMAAAAVVEAVGGNPGQAADAAAVSLQNTMGSVCDPVQGTCEIPCHTRNAVAASSAFTCADLILGGYRNPIPLDETIDASYAVGKALPRELRCTAAGGLAVAPSAKSLPRRR